MSSMKKPLASIPVTRRFRQFEADLSELLKIAEYLFLRLAIFFVFAWTIYQHVRHEIPRSFVPFAFVFILVISLVYPLILWFKSSRVPSRRNTMPRPPQQAKIRTTIVVPACTLPPFHDTASPNAQEHSDEHSETRDPVAGATDPSYDS